MKIEADDLKIEYDPKGENKQNHSLEIKFCHNSTRWGRGQFVEEGHDHRKNRGWSVSIFYIVPGRIQ